MGPGTSVHITMSTQHKHTSIIIYMHQLNTLHTELYMHVLYIYIAAC